MTTNIVKVIIAGVIAVLCIVALMIDIDNSVWAVPILTADLAYVIGNAEVTDRSGTTAPIISTKSQ